MSEFLFEKDKYIFSSANKIRVVKGKSTMSKQVFLYIKELKLYGVELNRLANREIKYGMKNLCLNLAYYLVENVELYERFVKKREIPFSSLSKVTKVGRVTLEKLNDFIIAYSLIIANPNFKDLQRYINIELKNESSEIAVVDEINRENNEIYRGINLQQEKSFAIVLTSMGDYIKIKTNEKNADLGDELAGKEKKGIKHYKRQIFTTAIILSIFLATFFYTYYKPTSIIKIQTTSSIRLESNIFNKVIDAYSETQKGKILVNSINFSHNNISYGIIEVLKYAKENKMLINDGQGLNIIVTGKALSGEALSKAEEYIRYEELKVNINNCGNELDIKPLTDEEKKQKNEKEQIEKEKQKIQQEKEAKIKTTEEQKMEQ